MARQVKLQLDRASSSRVTDDPLHRDPRRTGPNFEINRKMQHIGKQCRVVKQNLLATDDELRASLLALTAKSAKVRSLRNDGQQRVSSYRSAIVADRPIPFIRDSSAPLPKAAKIMCCAFATFFGSLRARFKK